MPSGARTEKSTGRKATSENDPNLCHLKHPWGGKVSEQAAAVNDSMPQTSLRPFWARSPAVWKVTGLYFLTQLLLFDLVGKKLWKLLQQPEGLIENCVQWLVEEGWQAGALSKYTFWKKQVIE